MPGIAEIVRDAPDAVAVVSAGRSVTFVEFDARQRKLVGHLRMLGVQPDDRVVVWATNRIETLEITIGCLRAGIVPVPLNPLLTEPEITYILEDSGARVFFAGEGPDARVVESSDVAHVITAGDAYERALYEASSAPLASCALRRPMHYTSGTTGQPKGVWVPLATEDSAERASMDFRALWQLRNDEIHLVCSPLAHSAPHRFALRTLEAGGTVVLQSRFEARETLAAIELFGVSSTFMVPTHLERIMALGSSKIGKHHVSSVRLLVHAGAPIRAGTKESAIELFPPDSVWEFYGSTEGQATRISTHEWREHRGSVGRAVPGAAIEIRYPGGASAPVGIEGEIWIRDPSGDRWVYWNDDTKTEAAWDGNFFTVGDIGRLDDAGYLYLTGRAHDTIITGGVNVYPAEIEAVLMDHPAVAEAMVYGTTNDEWGQRVHAAVVAAPGDVIDIDALRAWARERLAGYKCPRVIEVVESLPRTATGKLKRVPEER